MATPDALCADFDLTVWLLAGADNEHTAEAARLVVVQVAHYQVTFGAAPLENFAHMLRAQTINAEIAELLSAGKQQLVGGLGIVVGLDEAHGATNID